MPRHGKQARHSKYTLSSQHVQVCSAYGSLQILSHARTCAQEPEASSEGLGGTYFFMNEAGRRAAIVKPCDEEPLAPNNPKACDA